MPDRRRARRAPPRRRPPSDGRRARTRSVPGSPSSYGQVVERSSGAPIAHDAISGPSPISGPGSCVGWPACRCPTAPERWSSSGRLAHLVTLNRDGSPQVSCIWVGLDGDEIVSGRRSIRRAARQLEQRSAATRRVVRSRVDGRRRSSARAAPSSLVVHGRERELDRGRSSRRLRTGARPYRRPRDPAVTYPLYARDIHAPGLVLRITARATGARGLPTRVASPVPDAGFASLGTIGYVAGTREGRSRPRSARHLPPGRRRASAGSAAATGVTGLAIWRPVVWRHRSERIAERHRARFRHR